MDSQPSRSVGGVGFAGVRVAIVVGRDGGGGVENSFVGSHGALCGSRGGDVTVMLHGHPVPGEETRHDIG